MSWTAERIIATLKKQSAAGGNLSYNAMQKKHQSLVSAAAYHFGSYRAAVEKAGIEYAEVLRRPRWTRALIIQHIKAAYKKKTSLNWADVTKRGDELSRAAFSSLQPRLFGSWPKALKAAGVDPDEVSRYRSWSREGIVSMLKEMKKKKQPMSSGAMQAKSPGLYAASVRYFGSFDDALRAAGCDPTSVRLRIAWSTAEVVKRLKALAKSGPITTSMLRTDNPALYGASMRLFGSIKSARKAAGVD